MAGPVIQTRNLTKRYGPRVAVEGLDISVGAGEIFALLGPNGAGKTTTILMLMGLIAPSAGEARLFGLDPMESPLEIKGRTGYLPENAGFYDDLTALENLMFVAELNGRGRDEARRKAFKALNEVGLEGEAHQRAGALSRGMRQRLGLAEVLIKGPRLAFLDEPTLGLDPAGIDEILGLIRKMADERGLTVVLTSHLLPLVERIAHRVGLLKGGRLLAAGTVAELAAAKGLTPSLTEIYRHYYGCGGD